jgi:hypothetical protein
MKNSLLTCLLCILCSIASAQDLIYTVTGDIDDQKTTLDSILVENLSNNSRIVFGNLPALESYQINLTKKAFWGTTLASYLDQAPGFVLTGNQPGMITLAYKHYTPSDVRLSIYNLSGQRIWYSVENQVQPESSIRVHVGATGLYVVKVETAWQVQSFKAVGAIGQGSQNVEVIAGSTNTTGTPDIKSASISYSTDFSYDIGDTIRMSAYKDGLYALPVGMRIKQPDFVNFLFRASTVDLIGVTDAYVELDQNTVNITTFDEENGGLTITYSAEKPELLPGNIITVDVDTMGYLRKVISVVEKDGVIEIETEQTSMNEVFVDMEIKLNTKLIEPSSILKSTSSLKDISAAFTDEDGYIHPVEIIYHDKNGRTITKSALNFKDEVDFSVSIIDFLEDFSGTDIYGKKGDNVHFYISEGHVSLRSDAIFEFDFKYEGELSEDTKVKKGDLNTFKFYLDSEAEFMTKLGLDMKYSYKKSDEADKILDAKKVTAKFIVGGVPVWITFDCDVYKSYWIDVDAKLNADWGFRSNHKLQVGGLYDRKTDTFTPINDYTPENEVFPLNVEGEINASARLEIYPRAEIMFYGFFGPYAEIVPFVKGNYNAKLQSQIAPGFSETFLAWNSGIDIGLDMRAGTQLKFFFGLFDKTFGPTIINCFETPIWQTPTDLTLLTELPRSGCR